MHLTRLGERARRRVRRGVPREPRVRVPHRHQPAARRRQQHRPRREPRLIGASMRTHPRVSLSMLSQWNWTVDEDLAFFDREGVEVIGVSLAKMQDGGGWEKFAPRIRDGGYRVANLIGLGPFQLSDAIGVGARSAIGSRDALDAAEAVERRVHRAHDRAGGSAAVGGRGRRSAPRRSDPLLDDAAARGVCRSRSSTRTGCGSTSGSSTRCATRSTSPAGSASACAWRSTRAGPSAASPTRSATASTRSRSCS